LRGKLDCLGIPSDSEQSEVLNRRPSGIADFSESPSCHIAMMRELSLFIGTSKSTPSIIGLKRPLVLTPTLLLCMM
jgi:hypothetical protein